MPKHEFGIFEMEPEQGKRYDEYSPEKYDCLQHKELQVLSKKIDEAMQRYKFMIHYGI